MITDLLFEHFATLATAPDGIARLRELILQLAVQGKLGTQDAGDEPAGALLETIKKQIRKINGNGSREKEISPFNDKKIPFILPKNWVWTQIGTICTPTQYGWTTQASTFGEIHLLRTTDITSGNINWDTVPYCSEVPTDLEKYLITDGDIVISRAGSVGESHLIKNPRKSVFASYLIRFKPMINRDYFAFFLKSPYYWSVISDESLGTGVPNVNATKLRNCYFPLPPLAEQQRIVVKVNQLMALCDELEARQQQERAGCLKLGTASLAGLQDAKSPEEFGLQWAQVCDAFDLILDCPENVAVLRQTILQLAVQGLLTNDRSSVINRHPKKWRLATLSDIIIDKKDGMRTGPFGSMLKKYEHLLNGVPVFGIENVKKMKFLPGNKVFISKEKAEQLKNYNVKFNDILITRSGTVGEICVVPDGIQEGRISSNLMRLRLNLEVCDPHFLCLILYGSKTVLEKIDEQCVGSTRTFIDGKILKSLTFPLPPLALKRLKERAGVQSKFADAVIKNVRIG